MNYTVCSPSHNGHSFSYNYPIEYMTPTTTPYNCSVTIQPTCPIHSPTMYYNSFTPGVSNISPMAYNYYQQVELQVFPTFNQEQAVAYTNVDRTPLRRHQCFKKLELQVLLQTYVRDPHPSADVIQELAMQLNVSTEKVRQWFKNRRHSDKQKKRSMTTTKATTNA